MSAPRKPLETAWNRLRYSAWAPFYDLFLSRVSRPRRRAIELLALRPGERVLVPGAGTGLDLPLLPAGVTALVTDLTPAMLERARPRLRPGDEARVMDAQRLDLPDASFDAVLLHLIVAVIPDPVACVREAARVVKPGGRLSIFDKFAPETGPVAPWRRAANLAIRPLFTDINRRLGEILDASGAPLAVEHQEPAMLGGFFRIAILRRRTGPPR